MPIAPIAPLTGLAPIPSPAQSAPGFFDQLVVGTQAYVNTEEKKRQQKLQQQILTQELADKAHANAINDVQFGTKMLQNDPSLAGNQQFINRLSQGFNNLGWNMPMTTDADGRPMVDARALGVTNNLSKIWTPAFAKSYSIMSPADRQAFWDAHPEIDQSTLPSSIKNMPQASDLTTQAATKIVTDFVNKVRDGSTPFTDIPLLEGTVNAALTALHQDPTEFWNRMRQGLSAKAEAQLEKDAAAAGLDTQKLAELKATWPARYKELMATTTAKQMDAYIKTVKAKFAVTREQTEIQSLQVHMQTAISEANSAQVRAAAASQEAGIRLLEFQAKLPTLRGAPITDALKTINAQVGSLDSQIKTLQSHSKDIHSQLLTATDPKAKAALQAQADNLDGQIQYIMGQQNKLGTMQEQLYEQYARSNPAALSALKAYNSAEDKAKLNAKLNAKNADALPNFIGILMTNPRQAKEIFQKSSTFDRLWLVGDAPNGIPGHLTDDQKKLLFGKTQLEIPLAPVKPLEFAPKADDVYGYKPGYIWNPTTQKFEPPQNP